MRTIPAIFLHLCACSQQPDRPPNIVWIAAEDFSPSWGAYGIPAAYTPRLDQLAAEGILYRNAFANAPVCAPARSTLITGMYAPSLGTEHPRSQIPRTPGIDTVPEHLKRAGYYVASGSRTNDAHSVTRPQQSRGREPASSRDLTVAALFRESLPAGSDLDKLSPPGLAGREVFSQSRLGEGAGAHALRVSRPISPSLDSRKSESPWKFEASNPRPTS